MIMAKSPLSLLVALFAAASSLLGAPTLHARLIQSSSTEADIEARRSAAAKERQDLIKRLIPAPIAQAEFENWADALAIPEEERERLAEVYAGYRGAYTTAMAEHGARVLALVNASYAFDEKDDAPEPRFTPQLIELLNERPRLIGRIVSIERDLMAVTAAMTDPDHQRLARRLAYERFRSILAEPTQLSSARVDLVAIIGELGLTGEESRAIESMVDDYIRKMTPILEWRSSQLSLLQRERAELMTALGPEWELVASPEERLAVDEELRAISEAERRTEVPLRGINLEALTALARLLPPPTAMRLRDRFHRMVAPELFEDERALAALIEVASQMPGVTTEDAEARMELLFATQGRMLPLGVEEADLADQAATIEVVDRASAMARIHLLVRQKELAVTRREILKETARGLEAVLSGDEAALVPQLQAFLADLESRDRADRWLIGSYRERLEELRRLPPPLPEPGDEDLEGQGGNTRGTDGGAGTRASAAPPMTPGRRQARGQAADVAHGLPLREDRPPSVST